VKTCAFLDLSYSSPQENLACDEVLLDLCEHDSSGNILRFWESKTYFAVLGYSNRLEFEVHESVCQRLGVSVIRRCSGGGTVLQGVGCLNYTLILPLNDFSLPIQTISDTTNFVLAQNCQALSSIVNDPISIEGASDLAISGCKFSGNAQRRKRKAVLFHGTFLYGFDLSLIPHLLKMPLRQPSYRGNRGHLDFIRNIETSPNDLKMVLKNQWNADVVFSDSIDEQVCRLAREKYSQQDWTLV
jgi:lipoate---protein ligase